MTIILPTGEKVRSLSRRRYVVIDDNGRGRYFVAKRSDNVAVAKEFARRRHAGYVYDQVKRRFIL